MTTVPMIATGGGLVADGALNPTGFPLYAAPAAITVEPGGLVEIQTKDPGGSWVTRETVSEGSDLYDVRNSGAIRLNPIGGATYTWKWGRA